MNYPISCLLQAKEKMTVSFTDMCFSLFYNLVTKLATAVAQSVRAFEGWVLESQTRQTQVVKAGSDSSTAKRSGIAISPRR